MFGKRRENRPDAWKNRSVRESDRGEGGEGSEVLLLCFFFSLLSFPSMSVLMFVRNVWRLCFDVAAFNCSIGMLSHVYVVCICRFVVVSLVYVCFVLTWTLLFVELSRSPFFFCFISSGCEHCFGITRRDKRGVDCTRWRNWREGGILVCYVSVSLEIVLYFGVGFFIFMFVFMCLVFDFVIALCFCFMFVAFVVVFFLQLSQVNPISRFSGLKSPGVSTSVPVNFVCVSSFLTTNSGVSKAQLFDSFVTALYLTTHLLVCCVSMFVGTVDFAVCCCHYLLLCSLRDSVIWIAAHPVIDIGFLVFMTFFSW